MTYDVVMLSTLGFITMFLFTHYIEWWTDESDPYAHLLGE